MKFGFEGDLAGGFNQLKYFVEFSPPIPGEMIQFDEHISQMGWFNHQFEFDCKFTGFHANWSDFFLIGTHIDPYPYHPWDWYIYLQLVKIFMVFM